MKKIYMTVITPKKQKRTFGQRVFNRNNDEAFGSPVNGALKREWAEEFIELQLERSDNNLSYSIREVPFIENDSQLDDFDSMLNGGD